MSLTPTTALRRQTHRTWAGPISEARHGLQHRMKRITKRFWGGKSWIHTPEERRLRTRLPILESGFGSWQLRIHVSLGNAALFHVRQSGGPVDIIC